MLFSPYFWLLLVGLLGGAWVGGCTTGAHEVEKKWEADKAAREAYVKIVRESNAQATAKAELDYKSSVAARDKTFENLVNVNTKLRAELARSRVDSVVVDQLRDAVRAANRQAETALKPAEGSATTTGAASGDKLTDWFTQVAKLYSECRDQVIAIQTWYGELKW